MQKCTMNAADIAAYLGICKKSAYDLMSAPDFPSFRAGNLLLVTNDAFAAWILEQQQKRKEATT